MNDSLLTVDRSAERAAAEQAKANAERTLVDDIKWVMSSPRGRRFVWWLMGLTGVKRSSFNNSGSITAFNEGQRNIGLTLEAWVTDHCHPSYVTMLEEQRQTK